MNPLLIAAALWLSSSEGAQQLTPPRRAPLRYHRRTTTPAWPGPGAPPPTPPRPVGPTPAGFRRVIPKAPPGQIPRSAKRKAQSWLSSLFGGGGQRAAPRPATSPTGQRRPSPQTTRLPASPIPQVRTTDTRARATSARSPAAAANDLLAYFNAGRPLGTRNAPSTFVQAAQRDMGGLVADGIYGPNTRTRGQALIGKAFPPRTSQPHPSQGGRLAPSAQAAPTYQGRGVVGALYIP